MSEELRTMRYPVTRADWPDDDSPAEFEVVGDAVAPAAVTDPNVYPVPYVRRSIDAFDAAGGKNRDIVEVEELWQFKLRTDAADSNATVIIWCHDYRLDKWYPSAKLEVKGTSLLDPNHGGVYTMPGVLGTDYIGVQVDGHDGKTLYLCHSWS